MMKKLETNLSSTKQHVESRITHPYCLLGLTTLLLPLLLYQDEQHTLLKHS